MSSIMEGIIRGEIDCFEYTKPEYGPGYNVEEFNGWSTEKWVAKSILDSIERGEDSIRAVEIFQTKMLKFSCITKDPENRSSFYDAYLYCEYLLQVYCEVLSDKQLEDMYGYV